METEATNTTSALSQAAAERREARAAALETATAALASHDEAVSDGSEVDVLSMHAALAAVVEAFTPRGRASKGPRVTLDKAGHEEVAAYFAGTGLTRKELASAAGVSTSVIATVQNEKGDRWSRVTFEAKRALIDQWMVDHKAEIDTRVAADLAAAQARDAKAAAKAARATAAASKPATAPKAKAAKPSGKSAKPGRPSPARRQANQSRKPAPASVAETEEVAVAASA